MTEDNRMPNFWWCPTHHLYRGGDKRPCADAVRLVPAPPAPRVFFPGDTVPAAAAVVNHVGGVWRHHADRAVKTGYALEIVLPSPEERDHVAARARRVRDEREEVRP